jgi:hypothetical protein
MPASIEHTTGKNVIRSIIYDNNQVHNFLNRHFLHCLKALSLMGRVSESISIIDDLIAILDVNNL